MGGWGGGNKKFLALPDTVNEQNRSRIQKLVFGQNLQEVCGEAACGGGGAGDQSVTKWVIKLKNKNDFISSLGGDINFYCIN